MQTTVKELDVNDCLAETGAGIGGPMVGVVLLVVAAGLALVLFRCGRRNAAGGSAALALLLVAAVSVGVSSAAPAQVAHAVSDPCVESSPPASDAPAPTPTATGTPTAAPTSTPAPTQTPTPTPTPTPAPTPTCPAVDDVVADPVGGWVAYAGQVTATIRDAAALSQLDALGADVIGSGAATAVVFDPESRSTYTGPIPYAYEHEISMFAIAYDHLTDLVGGMEWFPPARFELSVTIVAELPGGCGQVTIDVAGTIVGTN